MRDMRDMRVLIIDDSLTIRAIVEGLLDSQGNCTKVAMAGDVVTARAMITQFVPTLITLDLNMPEINGLQFLDELHDYPHAPIVVVSSTTREGCAATEEAMARGANACFDKSKIVSEAARFIRVLKRASKVRLAH